MSTTKTPAGITDLGDNRYRVRVYDPRNGGRLQDTVTGIAEAKRTHARLKAEVQRVSRSGRRGPTPTVQDFGGRWRSVLSHAPNTEATLEQALRLHIYPEM